MFDVSCFIYIICTVCGLYNSVHTYCMSYCGICSNVCTVCVVCCRMCRSVDELIELEQFTKEEIATLRRTGSSG